MQVKKKKLDDNQFTITATLDADQIEEQAKRIYLDLAYRHQITPDPKRTPEEMLKEKFGDQFARKMLEDAMMEWATPMALGKAGIIPIGLPRMYTESAIQRGKDFTFSMTVVERPTYELKSYDPVEITCPPFEISPQEVQGRITEIMKNYATQEVDSTRDTVGPHDYVDLALETKMGEEQIEALTTESRPYQTGEQLMPKNFDDAVIGMKVGETKTIEFEGPSFEVDEEGNPKTDTYTSKVTINNILNEVIPAVTDEWVKEHIPNLNTVPEYEEMITNEIKSEQERSYIEYQNYLLASELAKRFEGKIADEVYEAANLEMQRGLEAQYAQQGMTREQFIQAQGMDEQSFGMAMMMQLREQLTQQFSIDALARHLKIEPSEENLDEFFELLAPGRADQVKNDFKRNGRMWVARDAAMRMMTYNWLRENSTINIAQ